jgi:AcrR family transcriptional regulator
MSSNVRRIVGSKERRERERTDTRQRILDVARDMFVRKGYEATTMRAIASRIEYTPTAIYHHFQNKEALLTELCAADFVSLGRAFRSIGKVEDPVERLRRIGAAYVDFAVEHPMHYQLMFMTTRPGKPVDMKHIRDLADPGEDAYEFLRSTCEEAIAAGAFRPGFTDPDQVAQMLWSAAHGLVSLRIVKSDDDWIQWCDVRETSRHVCEGLLSGIARHTG